jgi:hypothetical protein
MMIQLEPALHPAAVELEIPFLTWGAAAVEHELRLRAAADPDGCCGYFPALASNVSIISDLPDCQTFAAGLPHIWCGGYRYEFNFLRLSLVQQCQHAAYHLDSDAATALTGDVTAIKGRQIRRLLLNLSTQSERSLHYLNLDPRSVELAVDGSYIRAADPRSLRGHGLVATIAPRRGSSVHAVSFISNMVLHSGVDDENGHFVAAYGIETDASDSLPAQGQALNAVSTLSRSSH